MIRLIISIAILVGTPINASADYWDGVRAYSKKDYETAFLELMPAARQGSIHAQYQLGVMYNEGQGVPVDKATAMEWFHKAAKSGHTKAQVKLAMGYLEGSGLPQDDKKGLKLLRRAAKNGSSAAQLQLAMMHENGDRLPADPDKAFDWYRKAAKHGSNEAQMILARAYLEGDGVARDSMKAFRWAIRGSAAGDENAHALVNDIIAGILPDGLSDLRQEAMAFYRQGRYDLAAASWRYLAHQGVVEAQIALAEVYASGHGVPRNLFEAKKWQTISEEQGAEWRTDDWTPKEIAPYPRATESGISPPLLIKSSRVEPEYPEEHRILRKGGTVTLLAVIRKDGTVGNASISRSSMAHSAFEESALAAVSQWRYEPATRDGRPIDVLLEIFFSWTVH